MSSRKQRSPMFARGDSHEACIKYCNSTQKFKKKNENINIDIKSFDTSWRDNERYGRPDSFSALL